MPRSASKPLALRSALAITALMFGFAGLQAYLSYRIETADAYYALSQSAEAFQFQLNATFRTIDELMAEFGERIDPDHWPDPALLPWLSGRLTATPATNTLLVIGPGGRSIGSGVSVKGATSVPLDVTAREYFQYHIKNPTDRTTHFGNPFISRLDNQFALPVSRGSFDKSGKLRAIIRITVDPAELIGSFSKLMSGETASTAIFHNSQTYLAGESGHDADFNTLPGVLALVRSAADGSGTLRLSGADHSHLIAYRSIPRFHLVIVTGMRATEAYASWRREQLPLFALMFVLSLAVIGFAVIFDRRERRYEKVIADHQHDLERQVVERTAELKAENAIRAKTEEALRGSRRRLASIADSLLYGILVFNQSGEIVFANLKAKRRLGSEEMEGLPIDDFLQIKQDGRPVPFEASPLSRVARYGASVQDNDASLLLVQSGKDMPVAYVCAPLADDSAKRNVVISFRDIGDIKMAQWELLQASRLASVGQLASGIAHEINTPVQYIGNNLSFIADSVRQLLDQIGTQDPKIAFLAEELPTAISESLDGVTQISRIVLSMKEFSHPGTAAKTLVDINHALDSTLTVTSNVWKHVATIQRQYDLDLPHVPCLAGEMNQVFLNLIVNAAHAIEESGKKLPGTITLSTARRGAYVEIRVEDSGTGVPAALREKIFDPFFTTKEVGKGTGQGLAICQDVVITKHGGKLDVGGEEGVGAVFTIRLPIDELEEFAEAECEGRRFGT